MRAVVQRVLEASVSVEGEAVSAIGAGLLVFLGVEKGDAAEDAAYLAGKISRLRMFERPKGKMDLPVVDIGGEALAVSQFTLAADLKKGNRPSFDWAESPEKAEFLYNLFMENLRRQGVKVKAGVFGADMKISLVNDGPVTFVIDSKR
ncbi:MAG: D-aminoacyl-tRNA deacylase [Nitrospiraceae bacterium]|nr:D-aminoacyl-tRNA deacylase [Nitrospiraceae bacterium]